jgi:hypothetical protein
MRSARRGPLADLYSSRPAHPYLLSVHSKEAIAAINALHRYQALAAEVPATKVDNLAWVGVYPLDLGQEVTIQLLHSSGQRVPLLSVRTYQVRRFEVDRSLVERDVWIAEPDLQHKRSEFAYGDDDLSMKLMELGVSLEDLALPYKSNYPI